MSQLKSLFPVFQRLSFSAVRAHSTVGKPPVAYNLWCVGRNYVEHAKELGNPVPKPTDDPMIFLKAGSGIRNPGCMPLPSWSNEIHPEIELAVEFDSNLNLVNGAVSLDFTARDIQATMKDKRWPWTLAKSFKCSTALGPRFSLEGVNLTDLQLKLFINGEVRQVGYTSDMIYDISRIRDYVKRHFPVVSGDFILTGTPVGVQIVKPGDRIIAQVLDNKTGSILSEGKWHMHAEKI
mmetsp:Transcript_28916/g.53125  ORF Transcript_28916/g.53125 Transcript_28916/m.53125 type:complete len:236 (-) Transcript_28916:366-1073(-)|eukprot:CAMPEP_0175043362 /NCGR_PEP_ID=MMETSP0052_2-20121109/3135_1 /TAXON_ID=51329 ORGANISM="Polytomella parva, Strain SAG 63-3" /NCGR_SAMPLE_ID=MMETSP0052_2 /ASSEMBLY_ACC=CAM_ASM_000194 /LENGTH=235 /DNA_ID=CAMNT_0016306393 /DNA_START=80 /DNA_END=787 /DNA_ORIENTATION=+